MPRSRHLRRDAYDPVTEAGRARLHALLERQHYRLASWRTAGDEINWRRFFDINSLAALRIEDDAVFEATHATLLRLYSEGLIDGVRVDHVDGLADPPGYCRQLRARLEELAHAAPRVRHRVAPGLSLRRSWAPASDCRTTGRSTAPAATTSWTT